jgi:capping protein beta
VDRRLDDIMILNKEIGEELQDFVYLPLRVGTDSKGNEFILSDYNREGESYRSPFTNEYCPANPSGVLPPKHLRQMEVIANKGFQTYLRHYFDYGVISVYCWELDSSNFALGVFVRKEIEPLDGNDIKGRVSCSDIVEVKKKRATLHSYHLTSSVVVSLKFPMKVGEPGSIGGSISNDKEIECNGETPMEHMVTIGKLIEGNSDRVVAEIRGIYVSKMREILSYMRTDADFQGSLAAQELLAGGLKSL